jgi:hypothetical protein
MSDEDFRNEILEDITKRNEENPLRKASNAAKEKNSEMELTDYPGWGVCPSMNPAYWYKIRAMPDCRQMENLANIGLQYLDQSSIGNDLAVMFEPGSTIREQASDQGSTEMKFIQENLRHFLPGMSYTVKPMGSYTIAVVFRNVLQGVPFEQFHR